MHTLLTISTKNILSNKIPVKEDLRQSFRERRTFPSSPVFSSHPFSSLLFMQTCHISFEYINSSETSGTRFYARFTYKRYNLNPRNKIYFIFFHFFFNKWNPVKRELNFVQKVFRICFIYIHWHLNLNLYETANESLELTMK